MQTVTVNFIQTFKASFDIKIPIIYRAKYYIISIGVSIDRFCVVGTDPINKKIDNLDGWSYTDGSGRIASGIILRF